MMIRLSIFFLLFGWCTAHATHNRAGEITYRHLNGLTYEATITTYTKADSPADRPQLTIIWGDGTSEIIPRINGGGFGVLVANNIKKNIYVGTHTFPAAGIYQIGVEDPNRNEGIVNIPNSINIPFFVSSELIINPFSGINNSVELLNPPLDLACAGQVFTHNPAAFDVDGDSLSYRLVVCKGEDGLPIPGFQQPQATNSINIDAFSGTLTWDTPPINGAGEYNIAFIVEEWRNGSLVGSVVRDMQITVVPCSNIPPTITTPPDFCVSAGETVSFGVSATDQLNQTITLSAVGGPFTFNPPGQAQFPTISQVTTVSQTFNWNTQCEHIRIQPYQITFKATDDGQPINLTRYSTSNIRVVSPPTEWVSSEPQGNGISLIWRKKPCPQSIGYKLYRRNGFAGFVPSNCQTGVPNNIGYSLIQTFNNQNDTTFYDTNNNEGLIPGIDYCYLIVVFYPDGSESYASAEICNQLRRDVPIITQNSITETSINAGKILVTWSKPIEIDPVQAPGPFIYHIYRSQGNSTIFGLIDSTLSINDTIFNDLNGLNTQQFDYEYRIICINNTVGNRFVLGQTLRASSVFLNATPTDNAILLTWDFQVPWNNSQYQILRKQGNTFVEIGTTTSKQFLDSGLANDTVYCYVVKSIGSYSATGLLNPIENFSQEICAAAKDTTPPCLIPFQAKANCDSLFNVLNWNFQFSDSCAADCFRFEVNYAQGLSNDFELIHGFNCLEEPLSFEHFPGNSLAGCYILTAIDSAGNRKVSEPFCVDNCPIYDLPNIFTPNADGKNDFYVPFPYRFIESVNVSIFNRWGQEVFSSNDPQLGWNGKVNNTGDSCTDGVYYLVGEVTELTLAGPIKRNIKQTIQLLAN